MCLYDGVCVKLYLSPDACPPLGALSSFAGLLRPGAGQVRAVLLRHWLAGATDAGRIAASEALPTGGGALRWREKKRRKGMQESN